MNGQSKFISLYKKLIQAFGTVVERSPTKLKVQGSNPTRGSQRFAAKVL